MYVWTWWYSDGCTVYGIKDTHLLSKMKFSTDLIFLHLYKAKRMCFPKMYYNEVLQGPYLNNHWHKHLRSLCFVSICYKYILVGYFNDLTTAIYIYANEQYKGLIHTYACILLLLGILYIKIVITKINRN